MQKALFSARSRRISGSSLVRALMHHNGTKVIRWDPIFLKPLNDHARSLASVMVDQAWNLALIKILLNEPGDTVLIDNWRMLHGRSQILAQSTVRHIERVYLDEVFQ